jgi:hypothetical protein
MLSQLFWINHGTEKDVGPKLASRVQPLVPLFFSKRNQSENRLQQPTSSVFSCYFAKMVSSNVLVSFSQFYSFDNLQLGCRVRQLIIFQQSIHR